MGADPMLLLVTPRRFGFLAVPNRLRLMIPPDAIGAYMLLRAGRPFYVGRSDRCIMTRLARHPLLPDASHVVWEPCTSPQHAYVQEAAWFHILTADGPLENLIHPARPAGYEQDCPFCEARDFQALQFALPHLRNQSVARSASLTVPGGDGQNQLKGV